MSKPLTLRQEKFVQALTTPNTPTFCKPSAAYRVISPTITPESSHVDSHRMLRTAKVEEAVKGQLGLAELGSGLKLCLRESKKLIKSKEVSTKLPAIRETRETLMDYAKLTGQLVEKREVKTVSDGESSAIRQMVEQAMSNNKDSGKLAASPQTSESTPSIPSQDAPQ